MTGKMFCTTCKELKKSHRMATIGTTNFRQSTLDCHGDSREHIITTEKKERFYYLLLHLLFLLEVIGPHLDMSIYLFLVTFLVSIRTAMCLFEVIYLVVTLAQLLRLIFASFLFASVNLASFLNDGCSQWLEFEYITTWTPVMLSQ